MTAPSVPTIRVVDECYEWRGPLDSGGYGRVFLCPPATKVKMSRVVWEATNGPIPDGLDVLHSCDNRLCIRLAHLRLGTDVENVQDRVDRDRNARLCGERQGSAKLTDDAVMVIRRRVAHGELQRVVGADFDITQASVSRIVKGDGWAHVPPHACSECTA